MTAAARPDDPAATADRRSLEFGRLLLYGLALASLAAGIIHCSAALDHAHDNLPWHAALFVVSAAVQVAWAGLVLRRSSKAWLAIGLLVNFALVLAWVLSRSTGVPVIPGAQDAEPLGFKDVTTAFFELAVVIGVGLFAALPLAIRRLRLPAGRLAFEAMFTAVLVLVFFGLSQAPHSHGEHDHGRETGGEAHQAAAGHSPDHAHQTAADGAETRRTAMQHDHNGGDVHEDDHAHAGDEVDDGATAGHVHEAAAGGTADPHAGHHHDASTSTSNGSNHSTDGGHSHSGSTESKGQGHSHSESAAAGSGHHHEDGEQSAAPPAKEPEGHDHSAEPSGGSEGHDHSGGHDHGGGDPAAEELIVKAFFAFLNTITKAAGLGPV